MLVLYNWGFENMRVLLFLLGLALTFQVTGNGNSLIAEFNSNSRYLDLTPYILVLADPDHKLTFDEINTAVDPPGFRLLSETGNSFGFSKSTYWLKFTLKIDAATADKILLHLEYPLLDEVTFFKEDRQGGFIQSDTGDTVPFSQREIKFRNFLFQLDQLAGETQVYYFRLKTGGSVQIPLSLQSSSEFIEFADTSGLTYGFYYGVMLILMLAATVAYLLLRDILFLSYALYLFSFLFFQISLNGFGYQYLWSDLNQWTNRINSSSIGFVVVCGFIFCGVFLRVWQKQNRFKYFYNFMIGLGLFSMLMSIFGEFSTAVKMAAFAGILLPPVVLISNIIAIKQGYKPARFFLLAWGIFLLGVFFAGMVYFGLIERNFYTHNSMQIASLIEILILGYVLMHNVKQLHKDKEFAKQVANDYLRQLNEGLETKVSVRTRELELRNKLLSEMALRDSMTGLLNHNTSIDRLSIMSKTAQRYGHNLSVVMLDIDLFKDINDTYGHPAGDKVIHAITDILKHSLRESDSCGRYGGEEFLLLLPETGGDQARELANNIRLKIMKLQIDEIQFHPVSASFGISVFDASNPKVDLISEADKALYQAKESGRNKVVLAV